MALKSGITPTKQLLRNRNSRHGAKNIFKSARARIIYKRTVVSLRGKAKIAMVKARRTNLWHRKPKNVSRPLWRTRY